MSIRSQRIPGMRLGLGTFINSDLDAKRMIIYHGEFAFTADNDNRSFTQGQTRMGTIKCVILGRNHVTDKGSASLNYHVGTITGGTVTIHRAPYQNAADVQKRAPKCSYWMVGSPDPNRIIV